MDMIGNIRLVMCNTVFKEFVNNLFWYDILLTALHNMYIPNFLSQLFNVSLVSAIPTLDLTITLLSEPLTRWFHLPTTRLTRQELTKSDIK